MPHLPVLLIACYDNQLIGIPEAYSKFAANAFNNRRPFLHDNSIISYVLVFCFPNDAFGIAQIELVNTLVLEGPLCPGLMVQSITCLDD